MNKSNADTVRRLLVIAGIVFDVALLGYYKYLNYIIDVIWKITGKVIEPVDVLVPVGISIYSLWQISFLIDSYYERTDYGLLEYATFACFFPPLTAGPIVSHDTLIPQLRDESRKNVSYEALIKGMMMFSIGLAKKLLIADFFGNVAETGFDNMEELNCISAAVTIFANTVNIYFNLSGYCDMALGLGWMLNIDLPVNYDSPYKAGSITEFWKRWNITLTGFFRKYVFDPLSENQKGVWRTCIGIIVVAIMSGLWYGGALTFVLWGLVQGLALLLERLWRNTIGKQIQIPKVVSCIVTFVFINMTWILFRVETISDGTEMIKCLFRYDHSGLYADLKDVFLSVGHRYLPDNSGGWVSLIIIVIVLMVIYMLPNSRDIVTGYYKKRWAAYSTALLMAWCVLSIAGEFVFV